MSVIRKLTSNIARLLPHRRLRKPHTSISDRLFAEYDIRQSSLDLSHLTFLIWVSQPVASSLVKWLDAAHAKYVWIEDNAHIWRPTIAGKHGYVLFGPLDDETLDGFICRAIHLRRAIGNSQIIGIVPHGWIAPLRRRRDIYFEHLVQEPLDWQEFYDAVTLGRCQVLKFPSTLSE